MVRGKKETHLSLYNMLRLKIVSSQNQILHKSANQNITPVYNWS